MNKPRPQLPQERGRYRKGLLASIGIHILLVLLLAQVVFHYKLGTPNGVPKPDEPKAQPVQYVKLAPPPASSVPVRREREKRGGAPAPLIAPSTIPTTPPAVMPLVPVPTRIAGGTGNGQGVTTGNGIAAGVVPGLPDSRIRLSPQEYFAMPTKTPAEKIDSLIASALGVYIDSLEIDAHARKPGDWTFTTKDGKRYGWDQTGIRLGKFTIPNALLGMLPVNIQANPTLHGRLDDAQRADVLFQGNLQITEDQFNAAVKRIRARNEKLHEEQMRGNTHPDSTSH